MKTRLIQILLVVLTLAVYFTATGCAQRQESAQPTRAGSTQWHVVIDQNRAELYRAIDPETNVACYTRSLNTNRSLTCVKL